MVVNERSKTFGQKKIFEHAQNFFFSPTFSNVWAGTLQNVCEMLCMQYEIVQFIRLSFRMRLAIVRIHWHSFALYKGWADELCATKPLNQFILHAGSVILQSLWGFLDIAGEPDQVVGDHFAFTWEHNRLGGSSLSSGSLWERGDAKSDGTFPLEACFFPLRNLCQSCSSTHFYRETLCVARSLWL